MTTSTAVSSMIAPPDPLMESTLQDLPSWRGCDALERVLPRKDMDGVIFAPSQYSLRGTLIRDLPKGVVHMYEANLKEFNRLGQLIDGLRNVFYNDPSAVGRRIGYAPIRMLGWWRKNLKDEIDWLTTGGEPLPQVNPDEGIPNIPPAMGYQNSKTCLDQVLRTAAALNGKTPTAPMASRPDESHLDALLLGDGVYTSTVGIDFEMTGLDPTGDWVLNVGWAKGRPGAGEDRIVPIRSVMFGASSSREVLGNPTQVINGIDMEDVKGRPPLEADVETQCEIMDDLYSRPVMTAHSASMEDRLLEQCVDGYAEAKRDGVVKTVDTRLLSTWLDRDPGKTGNRLEDYARRWGTLDEDEAEAHHGLDDTMLMLRTEDRQLTELYRRSRVRSMGVW